MRDVQSDDVAISFYDVLHLLLHARFDEDDVFLSLQYVLNPVRFNSFLLNYGQLPFHFHHESEVKSELSFALPSLWVRSLFARGG